MKRMKLLMLCLLAGIMGAKAQIGYQISLLNTATGEARANETVNVSVSLSNNAGEVFYTETKTATTNDFGVLSLTIGNADTFANVDFSKLPFFIEVSANGVNIGKSQILSVPVAEVAKQLAPIDLNLIVGTWKGVSVSYDYRLSKGLNTYAYQCDLIINTDKTVTFYKYRYDWETQKLRLSIFKTGKIFDIEENRIYFYFSSGGTGGEGGEDPVIYSLRYWNGRIYTDHLFGGMFESIDYFEK